MSKEHSFDMKKGDKVILTSARLGDTKITVDFGDFGTASFSIPIGGEVVLTAGERPFRIIENERVTPASIAVVKSQS